MALLSSGCVTVIPNTTAWEVAGSLDMGMIGSESNTGKTHDMTFDEMVDFMNAKPASGGVPARGPAKCFSDYDYSRMKTALEQACRQLGNKCKYEGVK